jgi:hypothetical protein
MTSPLTQSELDAIAFAAKTLTPGQRVAFEQMVTSELALLLPATRGEGSLHRTITSCERRFAREDEIAVGPGHSKYGRPHAHRAKAK